MTEYQQGDQEKEKHELGDIRRYSEGGGRVGDGGVREIVERR